jgi:transposase
MMKKIKLTSVEETQLRKLCDNQDAAVARRARMVLRMAEGSNDAEIGRELGSSPATVAKWRERFLAERVSALRPQPKSLGSSHVKLILNPKEREELTRLSASSDRAHSVNAQIVLEIAKGKTNRQVADALDVAASKVAKWRRDFLVRRLNAFTRDLPAPTFIEHAQYQRAWDKESATFEADLQLLREVANTEIGSSNIENVLGALDTTRRARLRAESKVLPLDVNGQLDIECTKALLDAYEKGDWLDDEEHPPEPNWEFVQLAREGKEQRRQRERGSRQISEKADNPARRYSMRDSYEVGDRIEHSKFGLGIVIEVGQTSFVARFGTDTRTMAHGRIQPEEPLHRR